jgi:hypothetical protein
MWEPRRLISLWASTGCYRNSFTVYLPLSTGCHLEIVVYEAAERQHFLLTVGVTMWKTISNKFFIRRLADIS